MPTVATSKPMNQTPPSSDQAAADTGSYAFPASPAQEMFLYLESSSPASPAFNVPVRFGLNGPLDRGLFKSAFDSLTARHEALRTRFVEEDGNCCKSSQRKPPSRCHSLTSPTWRTGSRTKLDRLGTIEARTHFDLSKDPLFRAGLVTPPRTGTSFRSPSTIPSSTAGRSAS